MRAEFLRAVPALKIVVRVLGEPLRVPVKCDLPPDEQREGKNEEAPGIELLDKKQRCEHHGVIPVVDPARAAALVLHEPGLERAEEQDAYDVADGVSTGDQDHDPVIKDPQHMERADHTVESDPDQRDQNGRVIVRNDDLCFTGFAIIASELLLAARALNSRREEAADHLRNEHDPNHAQYKGPLLETAGEIHISEQAMNKIVGKQPQKQRGSVDEPHIMIGAYNTEFWFFRSHFL